MTVATSRAPRSAMWAAVTLAPPRLRQMITRSSPACAPALSALPMPSTAHLTPSAIRQWCCHRVVALASLAATASNATKKQLMPMETMSPFCATRRIMMRSLAGQRCAMFWKMQAWLTSRLALAARPRCARAATDVTAATSAARVRLRASTCHTCTPFELLLVADAPEFVRCIRQTWHNVKVISDKRRLR